MVNVLIKSQGHQDCGFIITGADDALLCYRTSDSCLLIHFSFSLPGLEPHDQTQTSSAKVNRRFKGQAQQWNVGDSSW